MILDSADLLGLYDRNTNALVQIDGKRIPVTIGKDGKGDQCTALFRHLIYFLLSLLGEQLAHALTFIDRK